jgi:hypothetical protein
MLMTMVEVSCANRQKWHKAASSSSLRVFPNDVKLFPLLLNFILIQNTQVLLDAIIVTHTTTSVTSA